MRCVAFDRTQPFRLRQLGWVRSLEQRAVEDSESAPWPPGEAYAFEQSAETSPHTAKDLRAVLVGRIEDMQHELLHDDFSQGRTLKDLDSEKEVQKWVGRLRLKQGLSYSVDREPHVVDKKERTFGSGPKQRMRRLRWRSRWRSRGLWRCWMKLWKFSSAVGMRSRSRTIRRTPARA